MKDTSLASKIEKLIQDDIVNGTFAGGEIITERELVDRYQVSRTPIKEALKALEMEGWVEITPRKETRISTFTANDFKEASAVRLSVEDLALKLSMQRPLEAEQIELFHEKIKELEFIISTDTISDDEKVARYNLVDEWFHDFIYMWSESKLLIRIHLYLQGLFARTYRIIPIGIDRALAGASEIKQLLKGFISGDVVGSETILKAHIINSTQNKLDWLLKADEKK